MTRHVIEQTKVDREYVVRELVENLERAKAVKGGSAVVNRAAELLGKAIGMFQEAPSTAPKRLEDLSEELLREMLANCPPEEPVQ